jgi:hypothetical protein
MTYHFNLKTSGQFVMPPLRIIADKMKTGFWFYKLYDKGKLVALVNKKSVISLEII